MIKNFISRLRRNEQGVAAIEFAVISPILVLLFFGAVELSNLLIADSKMRNVAASTADLLTQKANGEVSESDLNIANISAREIMRPLPVTKGASPLLASLVVDYRPINKSQANVAWTRIIYGGGTTSTLTSKMGFVAPPCTDNNLPTALLPIDNSSPLNDVLKVTARYEWHPWFATIFSTSYVLEATNYNMPRYSLNLNAGSGVSPPCN